MKRASEKKYTIKERLTSFFVLMGGTALLICLFTMLFSLAYHQRYRQSIEQLSIFNQYCDNLDQASENTDYFFQTEEEEYREAAQERIESAKALLDRLYEEEKNPQILREVQDVREMTALFFDSWQGLSSDLGRDSEEDAAEYDQIQQEYSEITRIHEAIRERYLEINQLILQDIESTRETMEQRTGVYVTVFLVLFAGICAGMFWQIQHISRSVSQPIGVLARKAELVREGRAEEVEELPAPRGSDEEIKGLIQIFDKMAGQVKIQIETLEENVKIRQELEESRFKELQMQINPHFLFNTLNMIAEKAYLEQADETVELLETAAKMFRYSLDFSGKIVRLSQELEELGNYVFMQEQRFGSRIAFLFELDEVFHDMEVPAMILQPLVENAIVHGIGMRTEDAKILIRTSWHGPENLGYITVEDNGDGMDEETLREVEKNMRAYQGQSPKIGLGNVYLRLKMFFEGSAQVCIESTAGKGTRVTLMLPWRGKDERCTD